MINILSSTHAATGGTELLQQLCFQLRENGIPATMYYTENYENSKVQKKFGKMYHNPNVKSLEENSVVIVPETEIDSYLKIKINFKKTYIWWLSVDNYYGAGRIKTNTIRDAYRWFKHKRNLQILKNIYHCVQSEYARFYLINEIGIAKEKIFYLSDYINDDYLNKRNIDLSKKENIILYNPQKGIEYTQKLMHDITEYKWVALEGMTNDEMISIFSKAKLYVDFGNHPGKDRIPREAALFYCCVITGKRGAADNDIDIPIPGYYKFETIDNIGLIKDSINKCMVQYELAIHDFAEYRNKILNEKDLFIKNALEIFKEK